MLGIYTLQVQECRTLCSTHLSHALPSVYICASWMCSVCTLHTTVSVDIPTEAVCNACCHITNISPFISFSIVCCEEFATFLLSTMQKVIHCSCQASSNPLIHLHGSTPFIPFSWPCKLSVTIIHPQKHPLQLWIQFSPSSGYENSSWFPLALECYNHPLFFLIHCLILPSLSCLTATFHSWMLLFHLSGPCCQEVFYLCLLP